MVKKLLTWLIRKYSLFNVVEDLQAAQRISNCNMVCTNHGGTFHSEALIHNLQNDKLKIEIGKGSHILGELHVFKYGGEIKIGEYCYIGDHSRIWSAEKILIGNNVLISHNVNIMDTNSHELDSFERANSYKKKIHMGVPSEAGNVKSSAIIINDNVWVGFNSIILKGVEVGKGAIIAAGSIVLNDVPENVVVAGNPAKVIKKLTNEAGKN
ncbi:MAG: acyltransferase [Chitinophagaceae bacterium]|nr:acyltransferase [Chitinophagaceae bacterium]